MCVFEESGGEALREGHEPERLTMHRILTRKVVGRGVRLRKPKKAKRLKNDTSAHVIYKTNPFKRMKAPASDLPKSQYRRRVVSV